jgi:glycerol-3-phosphate acyltransferase PlsX
MRVAVDAMGGDFGPPVIMPGSLAVLDDADYPNLTLIFFGREDAITPHLAKLSAEQRERVSVVHTDVEITMDDSPAQAVRRKPTSSVALALGQLKAGTVDSVMSMGNSGAVMAGALAINGRIRGVARPALVTVLPTLKDRTLMLDLGAIVDPRPAYIVQYALMATVYARTAMGMPQPKVGLLSNGEEPSKGNQLVQDVFPLLAATPEIAFVGNVEGKELLRGDIDIVVTDGFTGNVALKSMEGAISVLTDILREEMTATFPRKLMAMLMRPALRNVRNRLDYEEIGGAPLLGVNGTVIVGHGRSKERATANAVRVAYRTAALNIPAEIGNLIKSVNDRLAGSQQPALATD